MALYLPDIPDIRLGDTGVKKIMLGDTLVWPIYRKVTEKIISLDQIPDNGYIDCVLMNDDVHCRIMGYYGTVSCGLVYNFQYGPNMSLVDSAVTDISDWIIFRVSKPTTIWPGTFVMQALDSNNEEVGTLESCQYLSRSGTGAWTFQNDGTGNIYPSDNEGTPFIETGYIVQSSTHLDKDGNRRAVRVGQLSTDPAMYLYKLSD